MYKKVKLKKDEVLVLRSADKNLQTRLGFQYPESGIVECPDRKETEKCGNGLHGLEFGNTLSYDISNDYNEKFLIIKVNKKDGYVVLDDGDKVKFKKGEVLYVFDDYNESIQRIRNNYPETHKLYVRDTQTAGDESTQRAGNKSTQTAGNKSTQTAGNKSTQTAGDCSKQTAGNKSTQTAGDCSKQTAGNKSTQTAGYCSKQTAGYCSTQTAGYCSKQTAGNKSTQTAGYCSTQTAGIRSIQVLCNEGVQKLARRSVGIVNNYSYEYAKQLIIQAKETPKTYYIKRCKIVKEYTTTPENIEHLEDYEVFVFGSNGEGNHAGGAANIALSAFGAIEGQSEGLQGQSYAINTMDGIGNIKEGLEALKQEAINNTMTIYLLTKIGCGIAGYTEQDIIDILPDMPANVILPEGR